MHGINKNLHKKLWDLKNELSESFFEREEVLDGLLIAILSKQHVLMFGPPGTAKSMLARSVCSRIQDSNYFEWLLTKFSVPEEIFGPLSLNDLDKGKYVRVTKNKLPEAHISFLDEIFKASSNILNTLLSLINERVFHNNGTAQSCPLITMIGASNELPEDESLSALYDRFLLRFRLKYLAEETSFKAMLRLGITKPKTMLTQDDLVKIQNQVNNIVIDDIILNSIFRLRLVINKKFNSVSDRRWRDSLSLLKASAFLYERDTVTLDDLSILKNVLWDNPEDQGTLIQILNQEIFPERAKILDVFDVAIDAYKAFVNNANVKDVDVVGIETTTKLKQGINDIENISVPHDIIAFKQSKVDQLNKYLTKVREKCLGIS